MANREEEADVWPDVVHAPQEAGEANCRLIGLQVKHDETELCGNCGHPLLLAAPRTLQVGPFFVGIEVQYTTPFDLVCDVEQHVALVGAQIQHDLVFHIEWAEQVEACRSACCGIP